MSSQINNFLEVQTFLEIFKKFKEKGLHGTSVPKLDGVIFDEEMLGKVLSGEMELPEEKALRLKKFCGTTSASLNNYYYEKYQTER